jgi:hypothetical protein
VKKPTFQTLVIRALAMLLEVLTLSWQRKEQVQWAEDARNWMAEQ